MIHPLADVQSNTIGINTHIWQFSVVLEGSIIGNDCNINCHVFIENEVVIGNNVTVKSGVHLWNGIVIENDVFIGPSAVFTNDLRPRSKQRTPITKTLIQQGASIGANSTILTGITIGRYSMSGIGAIITKDVPPHALVYGNPAKIMGWVDTRGYKLVEIQEGEWVSPQTNEKYRLNENVLTKIN